MSVTIDTIIKPEEFLLALWKATKPRGMGFMNTSTPTLEDAKKHLDSSKYVDYFFGRPLKVDFSNYPTFNPWGYDRDAEEGMMQKVANSFVDSSVVLDLMEENPKLTDDEKDALAKKCMGSITVESFV